MTKWMIAPVVAALTVAAPAMAQDKGKDGPVIVAAVTAGTLGIGPELGLRLANHIGVRGNATFLNAGADYSSGDINYRGDLKLNSYGAMVDLYPFGGSFRISGGARINKNRVDLSAEPTGSATITVGGRTYTAAQVGVLSGGADVKKKFAPAVTLGWGGSKKKGFVFGIESGILFQGEVQLRQLTATGTARDNADFKAALETERRNLQDDVDKVKIYPIAQVMIGWRF